MNISYIILKHVIWRFQIYNLFREIFKFREDRSNNVFREILMVVTFILNNCFSPSIKFTREMDKTSLPFLDILVERTQKEILDLMIIQKDQLFVLFDDNTKRPTLIVI